MSACADNPWAGCKGAAVFGESCGIAWPCRCATFSRNIGIERTEWFCNVIGWLVELVSVERISTLRSQSSSENYANEHEHPIRILSAVLKLLGDIWDQYFDLERTDQDSVTRQFVPLVTACIETLPFLRWDDSLWLTKVVSPGLDLLAAILYNFGESVGIMPAVNVSALLKLVQQEQHLPTDTSLVSVLHSNGIKKLNATDIANDGVSQANAILTHIQTNLFKCVCHTSLSFSSKGMATDSKQYQSLITWALDRWHKSAGLVTTNGSCDAPLQGVCSSIDPRFTRERVASAVINWIFNNVLQMTTVSLPILYTVLSVVSLIYALLIACVVCLRKLRKRSLHVVVCYHC